MVEKQDLLSVLRRSKIYKDGRLLDLDLKDRSCESTRGYRKLTINGKGYLLHRLIWMFFKGETPVVVDHINGDVKDNRIENLQNCSQSVNIAKSKTFKTNSSGYRGVSHNKHTGKYEAYFWRNKVRYYLGLYDDPELAGLVVEEAKDKFDYLRKKYA